MIKTIQQDKTYIQYDENFIDQEYLPEKISGKSIYKTGNNPNENKSKELLKKRWGKRYDW